MEPLILASARIRPRSAAAPDPKAEQKSRPEARRDAGGKVPMEAAPAGACRKAEWSAGSENSERGRPGPSSGRCTRRPSLKCPGQCQREIRSWLPSRYLANPNTDRTEFEIVSDPPYYSSFPRTLSSSFQRPEPPFSKHRSSSVPTSVTAACKFTG